MSIPIGLAINAAKLGPFYRRGYQLTERGDHTLHLYWHDEQVAVFSQYGATVPCLIDTCRRHFEKLAADGRV